MKKTSTLPPNVRQKHGSYYFVARPVGAKHQKWNKLCSVKQGEIGMLEALLAFQRQTITGSTTLSQLLDDYLLNYFMVEKQNGSEESNRTALNNLKSHIKKIKNEIGSNAVAHITTKDIKDWLTKAYMPSMIPNLTGEQRKAAKVNDHPNSFNKYRTTLINVFDYALGLEIIQSGINPIHAIKKKDEGKTARTVSDSEIRRIKQAFLVGMDGKRTQIGVMMCLLMDFALLTGQRAKDVRLLQWNDIQEQGILFKPSKTAASTGERILIEWTPKLRSIIERIKAQKVTHRTMVFTNSRRQPLSASAMTQAWADAMARCTARGTLPVEDRPQFRQLRRTAITGVVKTSGRGWDDGQAMGAHASVKQTEDYVNSDVVFITKKTKAAR